MERQWGREYILNNDPARAKAAFDRADAITKKLDPLHLMDKDPQEASRKHLGDINKNIDDLVKRAAMEGIVIIPRIGK